MKKGVLVALLILLGGFFVANAQPAEPAECKSNFTPTGNWLIDLFEKWNSDSRNRMEISGGTSSFIIDSKTMLENPSSDANNMTARILSRDSKYKLYVAGKIDFLDGTPTTNIPLSAFSVTATRTTGTTQNPSITPITLSGTFQPIVTTAVPSSATAETFQFTLNRAKLDTYLQSPGNYRLTIYLCYCWY
ncbi:MAG TPA: hypothetical protein VGE26_10710 [Sphingobacteriaceae bacterium]